MLTILHYIGYVQSAVPLTNPGIIGTIELKDDNAGRILVITEDQERLLVL